MVLQKFHDDDDEGLLLLLLYSGHRMDTGYSWELWAGPVA